MLSPVIIFLTKRFGLTGPWKLEVFFFIIPGREVSSFDESRAVAVIIS